MKIKSSTPEKEGEDGFQWIFVDKKRWSDFAPVPSLTSENYPAWAMKMRVNMRAKGVWDAVADPINYKGKIDLKEKVVDVDLKTDQTALALIYAAIPDSMLNQLVGKDRTWEAWVALRTMHEGVDRVKKVRLQTL